MVVFRAYAPECDRAAVQDIWREIGWLRPGKEEMLDAVLAASQAHVAEVRGRAECLVLTTPGTLQYLEHALPFCGITGVTTSRIVRRQGFATQLTARAIAERVAAGDIVAGLGVFEQGFYNRLGFGSGAYEHHVSFDPTHLRIAGRPRIPQRFGQDDWEALHRARVARKKGHGAVTLLPPEITRAETMEDAQKGFGMGYRDEISGEISHVLWFYAENVERGPYHVPWMAYRTEEQFLELMRLVKSLGDQVYRVTMTEPAGIMLQDLIEKPFKQARMTRHTPWETGVRAVAWWQCRILDVAACLAKMRVEGGGVRFNVILEDPIAAYLPEDAPWRGVGGEYVVHLGGASCARPGNDPSLPTMRATVGAFTRLWLGILPASSLAITDNLHAPAELLATLDRLLRLPVPHIDWPL